MGFDDFCKLLFRVTPDPEVCEDGWTGAPLEPTDSEWVDLDLENDTIEEVIEPQHESKTVLISMIRKTLVAMTHLFWCCQQ